MALPPNIHHNHISSCWFQQNGMSDPDKIEHLNSIVATRNPTAYKSWKPENL